MVDEEIKLKNEFKSIDGEHDAIYDNNANYNYTNINVVPMCYIIIYAYNG